MELFNYQKTILEGMKNKYALFMEAGTGKTMVSLTQFKRSKSTNLLIICLASKVNEWVEDCADIIPEYDICPLNQGKIKNYEKLHVKHDVYIISFQSLLLIGNEMLKKVTNDWTIIIDESQVIKSHKSKISKLCHKFNCNYKMILTGTPQNKGYVDYYSQLKFLNVLTTLTDFENRFCVMGAQSFGAGPTFKVICDYKNTDELDALIRKNAVYFKRDRNESEIPEQKYINFDKHKIYNTYMKNRVYEDVIAPNLGVLRLRLRQICGGSLNEHRFTSEKEKWVSEFIENTYDRIVIFYNFNEECAILKEIVDKLKRPVSIYNGTVKDTTNFMEKDDAVLLVNYKSGGTGVNWLKSANICVFYTPPESYLEFEQARKRLDRVGQTRKPMFYCLRTRKTVEDKIYESIEKKEDFDNQKFIEYLDKENIK